MKLLFAVTLFALISSSLAGGGWWKKKSESSSESASVESPNIDGKEDPCVTKAKAGDCEFYSCFEEKHSCPKKINYATEYGLNFCKRYDKHLSEFTSDGQEFVKNTRLCIMEEMLDYYKEDELDHHDCGKMKKKLLKKLGECEKDHGICDGELLMDNQDPYKAIYIDNYSWEGLVRLVNVVGTCAQESAGEFCDFLKGYMP